MHRIFLLLLAVVGCFGAELGTGPVPNSATNFTGVLATANGGTGVANAGKLTLATDTTITGGGTVALGGFTLTVPATGTAALHGTAESFTQVTSTIVTGTAPLVVASTTQVANLNATQVAGTTVTGAGTIATGGFTLTVPATGTAALLGTANVFGVANTQTVTDAITNTNTIIDTFNHRSSGTAAASFGTRVTWGLDDDGGTLRTAMNMDVQWSTATSASRSSKVTFTVVVSATNTTCLTLGPTATTIAAGFPLTCSDTTNSTSASTGAIITPGGIAAAKNITFNGTTGASLRIVTATANASVAVTLGSTGPTGATAGAPQGWCIINVAGTDRFFPFW